MGPGLVEGVPGWKVSLPIAGGWNQMIFTILSQHKPFWDSVISAGKQGCSTHLLAALAVEGAQRHPLPEGQVSLG